MTTAQRPYPAGRSALLIGLALALSAVAACQRSNDAASNKPVGDGITEPAPEPAFERSASIYAAVISQLVTKDHTYGENPADFSVVYVIDGPVPNAATPGHAAESPSSRFSPELRRLIVADLEDLQPIRFVHDRDAAVVADKSSPGHVRGHGVLITLGPLAETGRKVKVEASIWINGLAGQWLTYAVRRGSAGWTVLGTTGPVAIS